MAQRSDWLPGSRQEQLNMAQTWISVLNEDVSKPEGETVKKYAAWGVPAEILTELTKLSEAAGEALTVASQKETRTEVTNAACKSAFEALAAVMRDIKKRWFFVPPLRVCRKSQFFI